MRCIIVMAFFSVICGCGFFPGAEVTCETEFEKSTFERDFFWLYSEMFDSNKESRRLQKAEFYGLFDFEGAIFEVVETKRVVPWRGKKRCRALVPMSVSRDIEVKASYYGLNVDFNDYLLNEEETYLYVSVPFVAFHDRSTGGRGIAAYLDKRVAWELYSIAEADLVEFKEARDGTVFVDEVRQIENEIGYKDSYEGKDGMEPNGSGFGGIDFIDCDSGQQGPLTIMACQKRHLLDYHNQLISYERSRYLASSNPYQVAKEYEEWLYSAFYRCESLGENAASCMESMYLSRISRIASDG